MEIVQGDGQALALISKIRRLSIYSIFYSLVLIVILAVIERGNFLFYFLAAACAVLILGALWAYLSPSKANVLICGIVYSLVTLWALVFGLFLYGVGVIFAILYFMRFSNLCRAGITQKHRACFKELGKRFKQGKRGDVIRLVIITLVDKRIWKCIFEEDRMLIRGQYGDEMHICRRRDICILGSNVMKPRLNVKFTMRMNGEIYRCKANRAAFNKLAAWVDGVRRQTAD